MNEENEIIEEEVVEAIVLDTAVKRTTKPKPKPVVEVKKLDLNRPVARKYGVTCDFDCHENRKPPSYTPGIDYGVPVGTQVIAAHSGTVIVADSIDNSGYGKYIIVRHKTNGHVWEELYLHLSKVLVRRGDSVKQGEQIARSGNTGTSTGPHLHFSVKKDGKLVNPARFF